MALALDRIFGLSEHGTNVQREVGAGVVTFLTMAYIIFVQPAVLSGMLFGKPTGMDFGAVMVATCLSAAFFSIMMGLYARYPIALAPGMGENFFFVFSAIPAAAAAGYGEPWRVALGMVFLSGLIFLVISLAGIREGLFQAVSLSMKHAISVGIGLFIAFIGMQNAGVILKDPGTAVKLNHAFESPDLIVFFVGLIVAAACVARGIRGGILLGIAAATVAALALRAGLPRIAPEWWNSELVQRSMLTKQFKLATGIVASPPSLAPTFFKLDVAGALQPKLLPFVLIFLYMAVFDTMGTLIGVGEMAGLLRDGKLVRAGRAFTTDAASSLVGSLLGTSTVTAYIESGAGIAYGGRTGLTAITAGVLFLIAPFFSPVVEMVSSYPPITACALVLVGVMMMRNVAKIAWDDASEAIPAFLVILGIPLSYSISDGLAIGFISYPIIKALSNRVKEVRWLMWLLSGLLLVYFVFVRSHLS
ncbi:MAG: NCS2 family permease [Candidatus Sumerlaeaceae bacterium]|nr:NCS2 family permease [Candidatus Sumerlaeaceae bacterium]